jgi:hypothetical protein
MVSRSYYGTMLVLPRRFAVKVKFAPMLALPSHPKYHHASAHILFILADRWQ